MEECVVFENKPLNSSFLGRVNTIMSDKFLLFFLHEKHHTRAV